MKFLLYLRLILHSCLLGMVVLWYSLDYLAAKNLEIGQVHLLIYFLPIPVSDPILEAAVPCATRLVRVP